MATRRPSTVLPWSWWLKRGRICFCCPERIWRCCRTRGCWQRFRSFFRKDWRRRFFRGCCSMERWRESCMGFSVLSAQLQQTGKILRGKTAYPRLPVQKRRLPCIHSQNCQNIQKLTGRVLIVSQNALKPSSRRFTGLHQPKNVLWRTAS